MPTRLFRHCELTMNSSPPALVPEYPIPLNSEIDVVDERVARVALADVEAGVAAARCVRVVELAVDRVEGVDPVQADAARREVRTAVAVDTGPEEPVAGVVDGRHVLDRDTAGAEHPDAVVELELAVEDDLVAVEAADREVLDLNVDRLVVRAG